MGTRAFQCSCGALKGEIASAGPPTTFHAVCFCDSCRAGEIYGQAPDPAPGPVGIVQTSPHLLSITAGADNLAVFSFGPKNVLRWHASCCGAPLFNTPRNPKLSFVGLRTSRLVDMTGIGPALTQGFIPAPDGKTRHKALAKLILATLKRITVNRITGRWAQTPLFDPKTLAPVATVKLLSKAERKALLD